jgi:hypothetical protein
MLGTVSGNKVNLFFQFFPVASQDLRRVWLEGDS